ncbi:MAG: hypothetical protein EOL88_00865 [Bacteroidia bacterium]|nr:hypothetical protein [Bacteroidia bacterium]
MKKNLILLFMLLTATLANAGIVYVCPDTTHINTPGSFTVEIHADENTLDFRGYRIVLAYDASIMAFESAERGPLLDGYGSYWWRVFDVSPDSLHIECMGFGAGISVDGPGNILTLTFQTQSPGTSELVIRQLTVYDVDGMPMEGMATANGVVEIDSSVGGLSEAVADRGLKVSPNPFVDRVLLEWRQQRPGEVKIVLIAMNGSGAHEIWGGTKPAGQQHQTVECDNIPSGAYLLRISAGGITAGRKVIRR